MIKVDSIGQEEEYAYTRFSIGPRYHVLMRVGPAGHNRWYAEISSVYGGFLISKQFDTRDQAAEYTHSLYGHLKCIDAAGR